MFKINAENLRWKSGGADEPCDLCLHGTTIARIGGETFEFVDGTVSATGLYLLRTLTENRIQNDDEPQQPMLPCCGNTMIANEDLTSVEILGCDNGLDWSVLHEHGEIKLITEDGNETAVSIADYTQEVYAFADKIEEFYKKCSLKQFEDKHDEDGYTAFWNEWRRRRGVK